MTDEEIRARYSDSEDGWTERKEANQTDEIRKTLVAFANSLPDGQSAILFVGVANSGETKGVKNLDSSQNSITRSAREWCYPPIQHTIRVLEIDGKTILAVVIFPSKTKPHFAGPAFIRRGHRSEAASDELFDELIAARSSRAWPLIQAKERGERVLVFFWTHGRANRSVGPAPLPDSEILEITPQYASFQPKTGPPVSGSWDRIDVSRSNIEENRLKVDIDA